MPTHRPLPIPLLLYPSPSHSTFVIAHFPTLTIPSTLHAPHPSTATPSPLSTHPPTLCPRPSHITHCLARPPLPLSSHPTRPHLYYPPSVPSLHHQLQPSPLPDSHPLPPLTSTPPVPSVPPFATLAYHPPTHPPPFIPPIPSSPLPYLPTLFRHPYPHPYFHSPLSPLSQLNLPPPPPPLVPAPNTVPLPSAGSSVWWGRVVGWHGTSPGWLRARCPCLSYPAAAATTTAGSSPAGVLSDTASLLIFPCSLSLPHRHQ
ncbi:hypothetical protein Pcinc_034142 [Petrolisthes cinctipes]|uniref:Uncharacterized protein n=1 Tax=Petrolisthes cinctipes TaxID=88211 RepID=A0AAE1JXA5_PETCI|nr:hypothetical protein Pcinc_034142 [Petrolisthes cinctipes]